MAAEAEEMEMDELAEDVESPVASNWDTPTGQFADKDSEEEEMSQDNQTPSTQHDSGIGEFAFYEPREDAEEVTEEISDELDPDVENMQEEDDQKEMNGDGSWRNAGRRGRVRSSGSISEPASAYVPKGSAVSKHSKQARRRNHHHHQANRGRRRTGNQLFSSFKEMLSESLSLWCISCVHMMIEIIVTLTHNCGIGVETGAVRLYNFGQKLVVKISDIPGLKADATRLFTWLKSNASKLKDRLLAWGKFAMTSALSCSKLCCVLAILAFHCVKGLLGRVGGERGKRFWTYIQESRFWQRLVGLWEKVRNCFRRKAAPSSPDSPGSTARSAPGQELERLLALADVPEEELDPFSVLGVELHATEAELKRAYRQLAVQVHPDKNKHPRAGEAFKVLRAAWDIVSNPETRREYELKRMAASELSKSMNEFLTKLQDDLKEAMNTMMCTKCEGKHKRFEMDREPSEARFCAECNRCHSAEEGDLWAESSMLGLRITYFACMDGKVYDITEWAGCQRISISPDTHRVPYHISFGSKNNSATRHRSPPEHPPGPTNPADLQDFFNRIFKGAAPPTDMSANGAFFPPGPHPAPGSGPTAAAGPGPAFPPPPGQSGFFMPGNHRPESAENWGETGKPPRRRKKVRKPFQR